MRHWINVHRPVTVQSAAYANAQHDAAIVQTAAFGAIAASERDTPELWKHIHETVVIEGYEGAPSVEPAVQLPEPAPAPAPTWTLKDLMQRASAEPVLQPPETVQSVQDAPPEPVDAPMAPVDAPQAPADAPEPQNITPALYPPAPVTDEDRRKHAVEDIRQALRREMEATERHRTRFENALQARNQSVRYLESFSAEAKVRGITVSELTDKIIATHLSHEDHVNNGYAILAGAARSVATLTGEAIPAWALDNALLINPPEDQ